ncbi:hypothetical protein ACH5RR_039604 [Cinchona calisaya]|uniref:Uncharacterized protein n=1 Tax=Cinchona calisaya TaxID=153742 RepID=A0ABD2XYR6_9GENT
MNENMFEQNIMQKAKDLEMEVRLRRGGGPRRVWEGRVDLVGDGRDRRRWDWKGVAILVEFGKGNGVANLAGDRKDGGGDGLGWGSGARRVGRGSVGGRFGWG